MCYIYPFANKTDRVRLLIYFAEAVDRRIVVFKRCDILIVTYWQSPITEEKTTQTVSLSPPCAPWTPDGRATSSLHTDTKHTSSP